ncbi:Trs120-domain-containing protein [Patellaria atrata CBS 101060]|uniref:Trs120-domain-containing protein n=1 Tax=Patellaria atrata CBS 101060 TaxID=1346257 RepID=A0A9P4S8B4_9PEZI|nr:Trs120-domain-containing protein [Patellaria atrata CBS 101060]
MVVDSFSPIAPARIKALLLPVGKTKRSRFLSFVKRLQQDSVVRLGDITPDPRPDRNMFSPLAFPKGLLLYDLSTALPSAAQLALSPFELYREPLLILGLSDGVEYHLDEYSEVDSSETSQNDTSSGDFKHDDAEKELQGVVEMLREHYPKALVHQLLIFDSALPANPSWLPHGSIQIPSIDHSKTTTMKTVMCDISALFLAEMTTLAKSYEALTMIPTPSNQPGQLESWGSNGFSSDSRRNSQTIINSSASTPTTVQHHHRMSMPAHLLSATSSGSTPVSPFPSSPATTPRPNTPNFPPGSGHATPTDASRPSSTHARHQSVLSPGPTNSNISIQGFGSNSGNDIERRIKNSRMGILMGLFHLMAGNWPTALQLLSEHISDARRTLDHAWIAQSLHLMLVSMILYTSEGLSFEMPSVLNAMLPNGSKITPQNAFNRLSSIPQIELQPNPDTEAVNARLLLNNLDDLVSQVLSYYHRTTSLPKQIVHEFALRMGRAMFIVYSQNGRLNNDISRNQLYGTLATAKLSRRDIKCSFQTCRKIAAIVEQAFPTDEDKFLASDHKLHLFGGIAEIFGDIGQTRHQALALEELVTTLTSELIRSRTQQAAHLGVHPATNMFLKNAADTVRGIDTLLDIYRKNVKGNPALQSHAIERCIDFFQAYGDVQGVQKLSAEKLAMKINIPAYMIDQQRAYGALVRTEGVGAALSVDAAGLWWDKDALQSITILKTTKDLELKFVPAASIATPTISGPFLYNPNQTRSDKLAAPEVFVVDTYRSIQITLRNLLDVEVLLESLELVIDGGESKDWTIVPQTYVSLKPRSDNGIILFGMPHTEGEFTITGCRLKASGCKQKNLIPRNRRDSSSRVQVIGPQPLLKLPGIKATTPLAVGPLLAGQSKIFTVPLKNLSPPSSRITCIRMISTDTATTALEVTLKSTTDAIRAFQTELLLAQPAFVIKSIQTPSKSFTDPTDIDIAHSEDLTLEIQAHGKPNLSTASIQLDYGAAASSEAFYTRTLTLPIALSVTPSLYLHSHAIHPLAPSTFQHLRRLPTPLTPTTLPYLPILPPSSAPTRAFILTLALANASPKPLTADLLSRPLPYTPPSSTNPLKHISQVTIPANDVAKLFVALPVMKVDELTLEKPIPSRRGRQFVVNASLSEEQVRRERVGFWCGEGLIGAVRVVFTEGEKWEAGDDWEEVEGLGDGDARIGEVSLSGLLRLSVEEVGVVREA